MMHIAQHIMWICEFEVDWKPKLACATLSCSQHKLHIQAINHHAQCFSKMSTPMVSAKRLCLSQSGPMMAGTEPVEGI